MSEETLVEALELQDRLARRTLELTGRMDRDALIVVLLSWMGNERAEEMVRHLERTDV